MKYNSIKEYAKINIVRWCPCCDQGWILVVKGMQDGCLYCRCNETFQLWKSPEDIELGNYIVENEKINQYFICASKAEIKMMGWDKPYHRVTSCKYCFSKFLIKRKFSVCERDFGWIVIKKNIENGALFCRCETCGRIWLSITNALRAENADEDYIETYSDATDEDIKSAGWDKYDNVIHLSDTFETK